VGSGADAHHVSRAQTVRPPLPTGCVPHPSGPVSAWMMSSPWGRPPGFRRRQGPPRSSTSILAVPVDRTSLRAGMAAIVSINLVRLAAVAALLRLVWLIERGQRSSLFVLTWGGLRGGLSIALALSVPQALGRSWILGATYLVVVFSIVIQGGSMDLLLRRSQHKTAVV